MQTRERERERVLGSVCLQKVWSMKLETEKEDTLKEVKWDKMDYM